MTRDMFADAYVKYYPATVRCLHSCYVISADEAEDVAQEAWVKAWEHQEDLQTPNYIGTWVAQIAINTYLSRIRRMKSFQRYLLAIPVVRTTALDTTALAWEEVTKGCSKADALLLRRIYVEGYAHGDLADELGCADSTARVLMHRARQRIYKRLVRAERGIGCLVMNSGVD